jgi:hypothetical protein
LGEKEYYEAAKTAAYHQWLMIWRSDPDVHTVLVLLQVNCDRLWALGSLLSLLVAKGHVFHPAQSRRTTVKCEAGRRNCVSLGGKGDSERNCPSTLVRHRFRPMTTIVLAAPSSHFQFTVNINLVVHSECTYLITRHPQEHPPPALLPVKS